VLAKFVAGTQCSGAKRVERVHDVGLFRVEAGQLVPTALRNDRLREQAEALLDAPDPGRAFLDFFSHLVADAAAKIAIAEALLDAGGDSDGDAVQASNGLRRAVDVLLQHAQQAGAVRADVELPEVYALLVGTSRAAAHAHLDEEVRARMLAIVFDGLAPHPPNASQQV
jgi:hypothetical protein